VSGQPVAGPRREIDPPEARSQRDEFVREKTRSGDVHERAPSQSLAQPATLRPIELQTVQPSIWSDRDAGRPAAHGLEIGIPAMRQVFPSGASVRETRPAAHQLVSVWFTRSDMPPHSGPT